MFLLQTGWLSPGDNTWQGQFKDRVPQSVPQLGCVSAVLVRPMPSSPAPHWPAGSVCVWTPPERSPREKSAHAMGTGQPPKDNKIVLSRSEVLGSSRDVAETCQMLFCYEKHYHNSPKSMSMEIHSLYLQEPAETLAVLRMNVEEKKHSRMGLRGKKNKKPPKTKQKIDKHPSSLHSSLGHCLTWNAKHAGGSSGDWLS